MARFPEAPLGELCPLGFLARPARRAATRSLFSGTWGFAAALRKTYQNCPGNPARNYLPWLKKGVLVPAELKFLGPPRIGYTKPGVGAGNGEFCGIRFGAKQASYRGMGFPDFFSVFFLK